MAIVQLYSDHPEFSFLIKKNPRSGMQLREVRQGVAYGWFGPNGHYNVYFRDADNDVSYKEHVTDKFEYLNVSRYNTPLFPLNAINEFFSAALKARDERDVSGHEHVFSIQMIHVELPRYIEFFAKHLPEYTFEVQHLVHKSYSLRVIGRSSLHELLHVVSVLCLFLAIFGNEYLDISDSILEKYIRSVNVIDAPFYIRHLFARNFLTTRDRYRQFKTKLEQTARHGRIQLEYGHTAMQRRFFISHRLAFDKAIVDVGCGEGFYALSFAGQIDATYHAIDIDEECLKTVRKKAAVKELDNLATYSALTEFIEVYDGEQVDVLLTEVIEHMPLEEARELILMILRNIDFDRFIITTPNADFNRFYELEHFRHEGHIWEMGEQPFREWIRELCAGYEIEFVAIGDEVDGIRTTQGALLRRKEAF